MPRQAVQPVAPRGVENLTKQDKTRHLSAKQEKAVGLIIQGKTDREAAASVGVARQTVTLWRNHHAAFRAELNRRRAEQWAAAAERLRSLVGDAVDVLAADLHGENPKARRAAAVHVLRAVRLYGSDLQPDWPTSVAGVLLADRLSVIELEQQIHRAVATPAAPPAALAPPRSLPSPQLPPHTTIAVGDRCQEECDQCPADWDADDDA